MSKAKKKKCYVSIFPHREASGWYERRRITLGTRTKVFPGLVWDPKVQGPVGRISCYRAFLEAKRRAKETGVLRANYTCNPLRVDGNRRIEAYGGYSFSKEVREVNRWDSNWGDGRISLRFKWGDEIWVGTAFRGSYYHECEPDPQGYEQCLRWDPKTRTSSWVRGRKTKRYAYGDCDDGLFGIFRRAGWVRKLSQWDRDYPFEYGRRSPKSLKAHWKKTAEQRVEARAADREYWRRAGQRRLE